MSLVNVRRFVILSLAGATLLASGCCVDFGCGGCGRGGGGWHGGRGRCDAGDQSLSGNRSTVAFGGTVVSQANTQVCAR